MKPSCVETIGLVDTAIYESGIHVFVWSTIATIFSLATFGGNCV